MQRDSLKRLRLHPPAKVNLTFEVLKKREDGYHEIRSLMAPVTLFDALDIEITERPGVELACSGREVPGDGTNLAAEAAGLFLDAAGSKKGVSLRLHKEIPVAAGLGGGSSNGAYTLLGLNRLLGGPLDGSELFGLAVRLGCDVPFFLKPGPKIARGRGERLEEVDFVPPLWLVVLNPDARVSTKEVYGNLRLTKKTGDSKITRFRSFLEGGPDIGGSYGANDLEAAAARIYPGILRLKEMLKEAGAGWVAMTGSGPTVFGAFRGPAEAAQGFLRLLREKGPEVFLAQVMAG